MAAVVLGRSVDDFESVQVSSNDVNGMLGGDVAVSVRTHEWRRQSLAILVAGIGGAWLMSMMFLASYLTFA